MHAVGDSGSNPVPAFLTKLWTLVEDPLTDEFISWDCSGKSFHVFDQGRFSKEVLPLYFKHSNIASFIRQLNMYGFRKVVGVEAGGLKVEKDDMEFAHQYFQRDNATLLEHIKRKVPNMKSDELKIRPDDVQRVLNEVRTMKGKQDSVNSKLESVKRENELLWLEIASLRQKHMKQQQIVNKLIQFLMSLVGNRGVDRKRKMPLMINDASQLDSPKLPKYTPPLSLETVAKGYQVSSPEGATAGLDDTTLMPSLSILEVTDQMPVVMKDTLVPTTTTSPNATESIAPTATVSATPTATTTQAAMIPVVEDAEEEEDDSADILRALVEGNQATAVSNSQPAETASNFTPGVTDTVLSAGPVVPAHPAPTNPKVLNREMSDHLDNLQTELESLKDMLSGGQYTFEPTTIMGLFNLGNTMGNPSSIDSMMGLTGGEAEEQPSTSTNAANDYIMGNEVVQYNPPDDIMTLFDLGDLSSSTPLDEDQDATQSVLNTPSVNTDLHEGHLLNPKASTTTLTEEVD